MVAPAAAAACSMMFCPYAGEIHSAAAAMQTKYDFMAE
jgi:hypothetical protein